MASTIDATKPEAGTPTTASVRANFAAAKAEIQALQAETQALQSDKLDTDGDGSALTIQAAGAPYIRSLAVRAADEANVLDFINPTHHAAIKAETSTHDCTGGIQDAIATGAPVFAPRGRYLTSAALTFLTDNQSLGGDGADTRFYTTSTTDDIFRIGTESGSDFGLNLRFSNFTVWSTVSKTAGAGFACHKAGRCSWDGVNVGDLQLYEAEGKRLYQGMWFDRFGACVLTRSQIIGGTADGLILFDNTNNGSEFVVDGGTLIRHFSGSGARISGGTGGVKLVSGDISSCYNAVLVDKVLAPDFPNRELFLGEAFSLDSCVSHGLLVDDDSLTYLFADGVKSGGHGGCGVRVTAAQASGARQQFRGCSFSGNQSHGMDLEYLDGIVSGCLIDWNGRNVTTSGHGMMLSGTGVLQGSTIAANTIQRSGVSADGVSHPTIGSGVYVVGVGSGDRPENNVIGVNIIKSNSRYGVEFSGSVDKFLVGTNTFYGNVAGDVSPVPGGVSATRVLRGNLGTGIPDVVPGELSVLGAATVAGAVTATSGVATGGNISGTSTAGAYTIGANPSGSITAGGWIALFGSTNVTPGQVLLGHSSTSLIQIAPDKTIALGGTVGSESLRVVPVTGATRCAYTIGSAAGDPVFGVTGGRLDLTSVPALPSFTVSTLPTASARGLIYVSDESGGATLAFADGANWRRATDRAVVS